MVELKLPKNIQYLDRGRTVFSLNCKSFTPNKMGAHILVGPNGGGKTSFIENIYVNNPGLCDYFSAQVQVHPQLSVQEYIQIVLGEDCEPGVEDEWQIKPMITKNWSTLSQGEKQRLRLYCFFESTKKVWLLDEAENHLDVFWVKKLAEKLAACIHRRDLRVFMASHSRQLIEGMTNAGLYFVAPPEITKLKNFQSLEKYFDAFYLGSERLS